MSTEALVGHALPLARTDEVERQIAAQGAVTQQAVSAATVEATRVVGRIDALNHTTEGKLAAAAQTVQVLQSQVTTLQARVQELEELHRAVPAFRAQVVQLETSGQRMLEEIEALRQSSLVPPSLTPVQARANRLAELEAQEEFAKAGKREGKQWRANQLGYSCATVKLWGWTCQDAKAAGYTCLQMREGGFALSEARAAGFTCSDARTAGWRPVDCREAGYSFEEGRSAGFREDHHYWNGRYDDRNW